MVLHLHLDGFTRGRTDFVQLWHQTSISHRSLYADDRLPLGPSAVKPEQLIHVKGGRIISEIPSEMGVHEVKHAVKDFRNAPQVARDAGFDGVQIQGGYVYEEDSESSS